MNAIEIQCNWVDTVRDFRSNYEELTKDYRDLGLTESQIVTAMTYGITPIYIKTLRENWEKLNIDLNTAWNSLISAMNKAITNSVSFGESNIDFKEDKYKVEPNPRNIKGKNLKSWEKKKFYQ